MKKIILNIKKINNISTIIFKNNIIKHCYDICNEYFNLNKIYIVCDFNVYLKYGKYIFNSFKEKCIESYLFILHANEKNKNLFTVNELYNNLIELKFNKADLIIGIGGGITLDIINFVACTYMRGINVCSIPTTLIAQIDAAIGGKCGINFKFYKNMIGSYYLTPIIIIDTDIIKILPKKIFNDGIYEAMKYGLIADKSIIYNLLTNNINIDNIIYKCINIKKNIIEKDFFDSNIRLSLNYGHTFGHAIESIKNYSLFSHGTAVALGIYYAIKLGILYNINNNDDLYLLINIFKKFSLKYNYKFDISEIYLRITSDKKIKKDIINFVFAKNGNFCIKKIKLNELKKILPIIF